MLGQFRPNRICSLFIAMIVFTTTHPSGYSLETPAYKPPVLFQLLDQYGMRYKSGASFVIRNDHVLSVQCLGAGARSRYGIGRRGSDSFRGGLWMRLHNGENEAWANTAVIFKQPLDVRRFNALIIWVKSSQPNAKFAIGLDDESWGITAAAQSRSDVLPNQALPADTIVPLIVPYGAIFPDSPLNYSRIKRISIEYGSDTVGNEPNALIQILGMAFVEQQKTAEHPLLLTPLSQSSSTTANAAPQHRSPPQPTTIIERFNGVRVKMWALTSTKRVLFSPRRQRVRVYESPLRSSPVIGELQAGLAYTAIRSANVGKTRWHCVLLSNSRKGWVHGRSLEKPQ